MKTTSEMITVMEAYSRGEKIEVRNVNSVAWGICSTPKWDWIVCDYRIASKPKKTVELYQWLVKDLLGQYRVTIHGENPHSGAWSKVVRRIDETKITVEVDDEQ